jgi:hypothetical protein
MTNEDCRCVAKRTATTTTTTTRGGNKEDLCMITPVIGRGLRDNKGRRILEGWRRGESTWAARGVRKDVSLEVPRYRAGEGSRCNALGVRLN